MQICKWPKGVRRKKGDRVTIYMPMIPEAAVAMLACARIEPSTRWFLEVSPDALAGRIQDCDSSLIITADEGIKGRKVYSVKS